MSDDVTNFSSIDYIMNNFANNLILSISVKDFIDIIKILPVKH
ncbi:MULTISPECIES: hypothetical protein [Rickettsieae]